METVATKFKIQAGGDLGNDSLKLVLDEKNHWTIKNAVARRVLNEVRKNLDLDTMDDDRGDRKRQLKSLDVIIKPENGEEARYFIGPLAIEAGEDETEVGTEKADNPTIHIPMLALIAFTARGKKEVFVDLVCGLPVKQYKKESRQKMTERLKGTYEVTFLEANGERGRKVTIHIENVAVVAEGVPVLFNRMMNSDATDFLRPELQTGSRAIIDVGAFTTDIPVIVNGKPDSINSDGLDEGISTYIGLICEKLSEATRATITRNQILDRLINGDLNELIIRGKKYPVRKEIDDQLNIFANKIINVVDRLWGKVYDIEEFIVVGGGGKLLKPYLTKIMEERDIQLTFIEMKNDRDYQNDPQLQNAFGYWKLAKQRFGA